MAMSRAERLAKKNAAEKLRYASKRETILAKNRARYAANPEPYKRSAERYRREVLGVPPKKPAQPRERYLAKKRSYARFKAYGIKDADLAAMLAAQDERCAICRERFANTRERHVDHDHGTGKVRGVLCHHCNRGLGCFRDDSAILRRAIDYLTP